MGRTATEPVCASMSSFSLDCDVASDASDDSWCRSAGTSEEHMPAWLGHTVVAFGAHNAAHNSPSSPCSVHVRDSAVAVCCIANSSACCAASSDIGCFVNSSFGCVDGAADTCVDASVANATSPASTRTSISSLYKQSCHSHAETRPKPLRSAAAKRACRLARVTPLATISLQASGPSRSRSSRSSSGKVRPLFVPRPAAACAKNRAQWSATLTCMPLLLQ
mmetsp:Transcript_65359/g.210677  ORF Transcript_65359/g.210677 Transcript_65359/m.210677 type:complete len:221 (-) Transcript_65359:540-1202(-)